MSAAPKVEPRPCKDCVEAADHCHGTLMIHADGAVECTEVRCSPLREDRHAFVVSCSLVVRECACRESDDLLH